MAQCKDSNDFPVPGCFRVLDGSGQVVAFTTTAAIANPVGASTRFVRVTVTAAAFIKFGVTPVSTSADIFVAANVPEVFPITPGQKVSALQVAAGGNLYVQEIAE
jgi:hypothetical protein